MDVQIYVWIVCGAFLMNLFVEFIGWKAWKHTIYTDSSLTAKRLAFRIIIFFDPLFSAIIFPMASDLYWSLDWGGSCGLAIVCVLVSVLVLLYCSTLLISYNFILTILPASQSDSSRCKKIILYASGFSVLGNLLLSWLILLFTSRYSNTFYAAEDCWPSYLYKNVYYIFEVTFTFQIVTFYLYVHFGLCILRKCKVIPLAESSKDESASTSNWREILMCGAASIIILFIANVFRSLFSYCSCYSYSHMAPGIIQSYFLFLTKTTFISMIWLCRSLCKKNIFRG